ISGRMCAVIGFKNTQKRLNEWLNRECYDHKPATKRSCPCAPLFSFFKKPKDDYKSRMWLKALNLKKPPKNIFVCSFHFVEKKTDKRKSFSRAPTTPDDTETCLPPYDPATPMSRDAQTQWEDQTIAEHNYISKKQPINKEDKATQCEAENDPTVASTTVIDDDKSLLFTGVRKVQFFALVTSLLPFSKPSVQLPVVDQILMTLMKLRLNLLLGDIAHRFNVSTSMASIVIGHWIDVMGEQFKVLIPWLPGETIRATLPLSFKKNYPRTACVIDCAESSIQRARNLDSRSDTFSHYKSTNMVKYLVAVAPNGVIMFISDGYAGRSSDKYITMDSGFLDYLKAGDEVMRKVRSNIPAFTCRHGQLTNEEVTRTRRVANARIHVERVIRRLKVFRILSQTIPITTTPRLDKILTICAGLANRRGPLIRLPQEV
uniref:THAP-type domain-containing protein n=1 Tax=Salarias fasciatus TaxID=181472 RepID=A0A672JI91_SALFA